MECSASQESLFRYLKSQHVLTMELSKEKETCLRAGDLGSPVNKEK